VAASGTPVEPARWLPQWKLPSWRAHKHERAVRSAAADAPTTVAAAEIVAPAPKPAAQAKPAPGGKSAADVYAAAKQRAKKRMQ
jgi:hypothetical protein